MVVVGAPGENASGQYQAGHAYIYDGTTGKLVRTLTSPDAQDGAYFGWSVAICGTVLVVATPNQTVSGHGYAGRAYVFNATTGKRVYSLTSPNPQSFGEFGFSTAVSFTTPCSNSLGGRILRVGGRPEGMSCPVPHRTLCSFPRLPIPDLLFPGLTGAFFG
jgi:outer membrane protein assembly factor BamB